MFDPDKWYVLTNRRVLLSTTSPTSRRTPGRMNRSVSLPASPRRRRPRLASSASSAPIPSDESEALRAGFEAGAKSVDPDIDVVAVDLTEHEYLDAPFDSPEGGLEVGRCAVRRRGRRDRPLGGPPGAGVLEAADSGAPNKRWVIGVESDEWQTANTRQRPHILTSILKQFDEQIYTAIADHLNGGLESGAGRLTVANKMITYSLSGNALSPDARAELDRAIQLLASGRTNRPATRQG